MDNPQHYQPLSHALHPPLASSLPTNQTAYSTPGAYQHKPPLNNPGQSREEDEEEEDEPEEEEEDEDEGVVEEQLSRNDPEHHNSTPSSPRTRPTSTVNSKNNHIQHTTADHLEPERKRRPGRPRGSKNRKPRPGTSDQKSFYYQGHPSSSSAPPQHPEVPAQNQPYYEFQWRVLNLCAEFYGAAEELVKATSPLVVAQCYQMGPGSKVDPLTMLGEAKRICDTLLANPSQLVANPPPPVYPVLSTIYQPPVVQPQPAPTAPTSANASASASKPSSATSVITNPQSFVVSLGAQTTYPHPQYQIYAQPGQYPTTPYYHQYPYPHPGAFYTHPPQPAATPQPPVPPQTSSSVISMSAPSATTITTSTPAGSAGGMQGAWADEETERLKKLAEDSRSIGSSGDIEWDWVVHQWGAGRTRHQILIKATSLGLKESSSRGVKRRRDNEAPGDAPSPPGPPILSGHPSGPSNPTHPPHHSHPSNAATILSTSSPAQSQAPSTPTPSPALQNQQRPSSSKGHPTTVSTNPTPNLPWPMPTVASTNSPVLTPSQTGDQRTTYYRPRPTQSADPSSNPSSTHNLSTNHMTYMYQPNGSSGSGSRLGKENGK